VTGAVRVTPLRLRVAIQRLNAGDELRCPHCRRWHPLIQKHTSGTDTGAAMLYFECRGLTYYGAQVGESATASRHETRKTTR
jgi:hypothetical protein